MLAPGASVIRSFAWILRQQFSCRDHFACGEQFSLRLNGDVAFVRRIQRIDLTSHTLVVGSRAAPSHKGRGGHRSQFFEACHRFPPWKKRNVELQEYPFLENIRATLAGLDRSAATIVVDRKPTPSNSEEQVPGQPDSVPAPDFAPSFRNERTTTRTEGPCGTGRPIPPSKLAAASIEKRPS